MRSTKNVSNKTETLANFAALCVWLITCLIMAIIAYVQFGQDFRGYYSAAKVLLAGGNPYDYYQVAPVLMEITGRIGNNPFYYPLWFGWLITPLALLPFYIARAVWMSINLVLWIFGLIRLHTLLGWHRSGWQTWCMNLLATFIFAWMTWKFEQTGILLFVIMVEIVIAFENKHWVHMGIYLAAASIKPNIMLIPIAVLYLWMIRNKIYRPVIIMSVLLVGLIILTTLLTPNWYQPLLQPNFGQGLTEVLDGPDKITGIRLNTTLPDWLKMLQISDRMNSILYGIAIIISLIVIARSVWSVRSFRRITVIALLVNFAITPYALQYDFPPLVIPLFWGLAIAIQSGLKKFSAAITIFMISVLFWERPISDGYWIVIGLCVLVIWSVKNIQGLEISENSI